MHKGVYRSWQKKGNRQGRYNRYNQTVPRFGTKMPVQRSPVDANATASGKLLIWLAFPMLLWGQWGQPLDQQLRVAFYAETPWHVVMARAPRIESEGAVHAASIRGSERRALFKDNSDRRHVVRILAESGEMLRDVAQFLICGELAWFSALPPGMAAELRARSVEIRPRVVV